MCVCGGGGGYGIAAQQANPLEEEEVQSAVVKDGKELRESEEGLENRRKVWCMVYGVWCMVYDVWCMVYGV